MVIFGLVGCEVFANTSESNLFCESGVKLFREGDFAGAESMFEKALATQPERGQAYINVLHNLLIVYERIGNVEKSQEVTGLIAKYETKHTKSPTIEFAKPPTTKPNVESEPEQLRPLDAGLVRIREDVEGAFFAEGTIRNNTDSYCTYVTLTMEVTYEDGKTQVKSVSVEGLKPFERKSYSERLFRHNDLHPKDAKILKLRANKL